MNHLFVHHFVASLGACNFTVHLPVRILLFLNRRVQLLYSLRTRAIIIIFTSLHTLNLSIYFIACFACIHPFIGVIGRVYFAYPCNYFYLVLHRYIGLICRVRQFYFIIYMWKYAARSWSRVYVGIHVPSVYSTPVLS